MRLVVDTNILVAELLRNRGVDLIQSQNLELLLAEKMKNEAKYELQKRISIIVNQANLTPEQGQFQLERAWGIIDRKILTVPWSDYQSFEAEARKRIPRDPNDWETVALALALPAAIWTEDYDFFGCGCPTWTTQTLLLQINWTFMIAIEFMAKTLVVKRQKQKFRGYKEYISHSAPQERNIQSNTKFPSPLSIYTP